MLQLDINICILQYPYVYVKVQYLDPERSIRINQYRDPAGSLYLK